MSRHHAEMIIPRYGSAQSGGDGLLLQNRAHGYARALKYLGASHLPTPKSGDYKTDSPRAVTGMNMRAWWPSSMVKQPVEDLFLGPVR